VQAVLPVGRVEQAQRAEQAAEGPRAAARAAVAASDGCRREASALAWAGRASIQSTVPAENDATAK
jgi:hypothetical protein